jgi:SAM-dependent methyltransferase
VPRGILSARRAIYLSLGHSDAGVRQEPSRRLVERAHKHRDSISQRESAWSTAETSRAALRAWANSLRDRCQGWLSSYEGYGDFHRRRYEFVLGICKQFVKPGEARVIDIGRSELSSRLAGVYSEVHTLGFPLGTLAGTPAAAVADGGEPFRGHLVFDLNDAFEPERWPEIPGADLICFAEVIEHLYTAPEMVLLFLRSALKPTGYIVCQTPNAAALHKRINLALGIQPYERIRPVRDNPGHFREYTRAELIEVGREAGLRTVFHQYADYFGVDGSPLRRATGRVLRWICAIYPPFKRGQTIVFSIDPNARPPAMAPTHVERVTW